MKRGIRQLYYTYIDDTTAKWPAKGNKMYFLHKSTGLHRKRSQEENVLITSNFLRSDVCTADFKKYHILRYLNGETSHEQL